jgi:hypothetical protein
LIDQINAIRQIINEVEKTSIINLWKGRFTFGDQDVMMDVWKADFPFEGA